MKFPILFMGIVMLTMPAFADDAATTQTVIERKTCAEIKAEIATLSAIENPDDATLENLKQLQVQHRSNCVAKSVGRRTIARTIPLINNAESTSVKNDALTEYLNSKKSNCEKLNGEIEKLAKDNTSATNAIILGELQRYYDMDCTEHKVAATGPDKPSAPTVPEKSDEELAAEFDANLAAGLCGDGTKPNKFGCCAGETFKDMGNTIFACCPKDGGLCFPPIK